MDIYIIDTSSLIEMKNKYPKDVSIFNRLWKNIEKLCAKGRLIAPVEVLKEIKQGDDELTKWIKNKKISKMFIEVNKNQMDKVSEILSDCPFLANHDKTGPNADPWIIALAIVKNQSEGGDLFPNKYIVVTEEAKTKKEKLPAVCKRYGIECINLIELFRNEKW